MPPILTVTSLKPQIPDSLLSYQLWVLIDAACLQKLKTDEDNHVLPTTTTELSLAGNFDTFLTLRRTLTCYGLMVMIKNTPAMTDLTMPKLEKKRDGTLIPENLPLHEKLWWQHAPHPLHHPSRKNPDPTAAQVEGALEGELRCSIHWPQNKISYLLSEPASYL